MASTFTTNKHLELPANNDDVDTWDVPVNADMTAIDTALGGTATINVVAASGNVTLSLAQYKPPIIILTGLLTANVNYQFPANVGGTWTVLNSTTGAFSVAFSSATAAGSAVTIPQSYSAIIYCDGTNVRLSPTAPGSAAGLSTTVQYNSSGALAGSTNLVFDGTKLTALSVRVSGLGAGSLQTNASGDVSVVALTSSFAANGYTTLPGGGIFQWGTTGSIAAGASAAIALPLTFPSNFFTVTITPLFSGGVGSIYSYASITSVAGFLIINGSGSAGPFYWQAIGN